MTDLKQAKTVISSAMKAFDAEQVSIHRVPNAGEGAELEQIGIRSNAQNSHITPGNKMHILNCCLI